jgi:predicted  nucleic acid-binding Zn-ribbon protein
VLFSKFKRNSDNMKQQVMKEHYAGVAGRSDGKNQLQTEERKVKDRIKKAQEELATIENNKSFFALSKNAEAVLKQFDSNIQKLKEQIARLEKELTVIRNTKPGNAQ